MDNHEIERRLRLPAPDEPAILPALALPEGLDAARVRGRIRVAAAGGGRAFRSPTLVVSVLVLLALLIGAAITGALRLRLLQDPLRGEHGFVGRGIVLEYPDDWIRVTPKTPTETTASTALIVSSTGVDGCAPEELPPEDLSGTDTDPPLSSSYSGLEDRILACVVMRPMAPGEIRVELSLGWPQQIGVGLIEPFDAPAWFGPGTTLANGEDVPTEANGWIDMIDGGPAKLVVTNDPGQIGADETRTWGIYVPGQRGGIVFVRAHLRGPGLESLRTRVDAIASSLRFMDKPEELDPATLDAALARELDRWDREWREIRGSRLIGCFPRAEGEQRVVVADGPGGRLPEPVTVACRTAVEPTPLRLWRATLTASWQARGGQPGGEAVWELFFGAGGANGGGDPGRQDPFPGTNVNLPAPLDAPLVVPVGSIVEVLPPGLDDGNDPIQALYQEPSETIGDLVVYQASAGRRFSVVGGPISHVGVDWYLVDGYQGAHPGDPAWLPATDRVRPLVKVVEADCPSETSVADLVWLLPAERLACFGDTELALDPAILHSADPSQVGGVTGEPEWLAPSSILRLYGPEGPDGVEPGLPVVILPSLAESVPDDAWLRVRGHFDHEAAQTCQREFPEGWLGRVESPATQVLRCRELFVITGFEPRSVP